MGESLMQQRRVGDEGPRVVKPFSGRRERTVSRNKSRLTMCQQPRQYIGGERYPDLLGVKSVEAAL